MAEERIQGSKEDALLAAALFLFTTRGFHGTPTALIAKEAGVATGTLFNYFPTKEALIDELYRRIKHEAGLVVRSGTGHDGAIADKTYQVLKNFVMWGVANPDKIRFMEQYSSSPDISESAHKYGESEFFFLWQMFSEGISQGTIRDIPLDILISITYSWARVLIWHICDSSVKMDAEQVIEQVYPVLSGLFNK